MEKKHAYCGSLGNRRTPAHHRALLDFWLKPKRQKLQFNTGMMAAACAGTVILPKTAKDDFNEQHR
jgi:hypothetical protein